MAVGCNSVTVKQYIEASKVSQLTLPLSFASFFVSFKFSLIYIYIYIYIYIIYIYIKENLQTGFLFLSFWFHFPGHCYYTYSVNGTIGERE